MKLIGHAFLKGRIDFSRKENPWAFARIDAGMKQSQRDRIHVDPAQAQVELRSADINDGVEPEWMEEIQQILRSSNSLHLQYKSGVLRFRRATHHASKHQQFVTLGNQDEFDLYSQEHWQQIRYLYAMRRPSSAIFELNTLITHRENSSKGTKRIEIAARLEESTDSDDTAVIFSATGSQASVDIVEWRGTVKEGKVGRYAPDDSHIEFSVQNVHRPFTFYHEIREEFNNHSYKFSGEKIWKQLDRLIKKNLASQETAKTERA